MKKKLFKKLSLKKELISNLNSNEQKKIKGGFTFECETKEKESCSVVLICCIPPKKLMNLG